MGIKLKVRKKKPVEFKDDEVIYSQVSRYWHNKSQALSYLRGRCPDGNPTGMFLRSLLELRET